MNSPKMYRGVLVFLSSLLLSCGLWAQTLTDKAPSQPGASGQATATSAVQGHDNTFIIGNDDVLSVSVWKEPDISKIVPVRSDGKISLPLAGEVQAAGRTPLALEQDISEKLKSFISEPVVTVIVQQINSQKINVLGMVAKPGSYPLTNAATVLDAISQAGGFRDFAKKKSIYVLRQGADGKQTKLPFNYKEVIKGQNPEQNVRLQPRDTVVVP